MRGSGDRERAQVLSLLHDDHEFGQVDVLLAGLLGEGDRDGLGVLLDTEDGTSGEEHCDSSRL